MRKNRARFEEGKPADPTENMSPEDAEKWEDMNDKYQDKLKDKESRIAQEVARIHMSNLDFDVTLIDDGRRVWRGEAQELLHDNDYDPELERALFKLSQRRRGDEVMVGGGAGASWVIRRV